MFCDLIMRNEAATESWCLRDKTFYYSATIKWVLSFVFSVLISFSIFYVQLLVCSKGRELQVCDNWALITYNQQNVLIHCYW